MTKKHFWTKGISLIALTLALAVVVSACTPQPQKPASDTTTQDDQGASTDETTPAQDEVTVVLNTQNNSGQTGTAVLKSEGDGTRVTINIENAPATTPQPAHIHLSSCATIGAVKYPLTALVNGKSETVVPATLKELTSKEQLSINIHKSAAEASVYTACGDLPFTADAMIDVSATTGSGSTQDTTTSGTTQSAAKVITVNVSGANFAFTPSEIKVKKGDKVKIVFSSTGGFHDFVLDAFNVRTDRVNTGQTAAPIEFTADKVGTFEYYCSVGSHRSLGMVGKLIVE